MTVGTVMERSHVPLNKWALASHMMAEKGISPKQLRRELIAWQLSNSSVYVLTHSRGP
mgnify:CR=1 FL=1